MSRASKTRRLLLFLVLASASSALAPMIYAKTDCDRWLRDYKQELLHKRAVQRLRAAKWRMEHRIVAIVHPTPVRPVHKPVLHRRMSPLEALNHFKLACDIVPPVEPDLEPTLTPVLMAGLPTFSLPPASYVTPAVTPEAGPATDQPAPPAGPLIPGPGVGQPPIETFSPPVIPIPIPPVTPPVVPEVPEPSSIVLVLTGASMAVAAGRRRFFRRPVA